MGTGSNSNLKKLSGSSGKLEKDSNNRIGFVDFIRGVAILSIVWGHVVGGDKGIEIWNHYNNFFKIVIFYFLPGWFLYEKELPELKMFFGKKLNAFGVPYICFSIIIISIDVCLVAMNRSSIMQVIQDGYRTICLAGIGTLWFLPTLFGAEMIAAYAIKKKKLKCITIIGGAFSVIGVAILNGIRSDTLLFDVITAPVIVVLKSIIGYLFIVFGMFMHSLIIKQKWNVYLIAVIVIFSVLVCNLVKISDYNHLMIDNIATWLIASVLACISIVLICRNFLYQILEKSVKPIKWVIEFFGKNSLVILCTHYSVVMPYIKGDNSYLNFILVLIIEVILCIILNTKQLCWIIGKRR